MSDILRQLSTKQKALGINLDPLIYGSFAEIGAGQEVARYFFQAGGAAGTVAKSISAYDMAMSDAIYGKEESGRYVCENRLGKMLDREFRLLQERLKGSRPQGTRYFAFADTVAAKAFKSNRDCHGWLGVRFQHHSDATPSDVVLHIRMLDKDNLQQQNAIGIIGVNLVHACFFCLDSMSKFMKGLMDNLSTDRLEIDMIKIKGPAFAGIDHRPWALELVKNEYTKAIMFDEHGEPLQPAEGLYKKNVLVLRGSFRPPHLMYFDMFNRASEKFMSELDEAEKGRMESLCEISMNNLLQRGEVDNADFLMRVDLLASMGKKVLITNYDSFGLLLRFLQGVSHRPVRLVTGTYNLEQVFKDLQEKGDGGTLFQNLGELFGQKTKVYLYPGVNKKGETVNSSTLNIRKEQKPLISFLKGNELIEDLVEVDPDMSKIWSRTLIDLIQNGDPAWEKMVPKKVAERVKNDKLFGLKD